MSESIADVMLAVATSLPINVVVTASFYTSNRCAILILISSKRRKDRLLSTIYLKIVYQLTDVLLWALNNFRVSNNNLK